MFSGVNVGGIRPGGPIELNIPELPGAACKGYQKLKDFHPAVRATPADKAQAICAGCPVRQDCLDWVMALERRTGSQESGVWGGLTQWERQDIRDAEPPSTRWCRSGRHKMTDDNWVTIGRWRTCKACRRLSQSLSVRKDAA